MSNKKFLLFIISLVALSVSLIVLITAMILHAIFDNGSAAPAVFGMISFVLAFVAIISICLFGKGEKR